MADKYKGNNGGGGGGRGGGGEIMESTFASGGGGSEATFHKLLPNIAEAVEILEMATVEDIQQKLEEITSVKYSKNELILGLENGLQLGLFDVERQFKLNTKYIREELRAGKGDVDKITSLVKKKLQEEKQIRMNACRKKSGRIRSKSVRSRKGKKSPREEDWSPAVLQKADKLKICDRCKKKSIPSVESGCEAGPRVSESDMSVASEPSKTKNVGKRSAVKPDASEAKKKKLSSPEPQKSHPMPQKKSKLLVERNNPLDTAPPYCDIFS